MVRTVASLTSVDLGFDPRNVMAVRIAAPPDRAQSADSLRAFFDEAVARAAAVGGVSSAAIISARPFYGIGPATRIDDALAPPPRPDDPSIVADVQFVGAGALTTLGVPLLAGQSFDDAIDATEPPRVVVSEELARRVWPNKATADVVGRRLRINLNGGITPEVIGVVKDVHLGSARTAPRSVAWLSAARFPTGETDLVLRTSVPPESVVPTLRAAVNELSPGLPIYRVGSMAVLVDESLAADRFTAFLLSGFAAVALALAAIGIFGVFSADVVRQRREIGLRLALGGSALGIVAMLLRRAAGRAAAGLASGRCARDSVWRRRRNP